MNFSALAGCDLASRFSRLRVIKVTPDTGKQFIYNAMMESSYKKIIESNIDVDDRIIYGDANGKFKFNYRGVSESVHGVALIKDVPHLVKVIFINEPIMIETLRAKFDSVYLSLQAMMKLSSQGGKPEITKSLILAVDVNEFTVTKMILDADDIEQESLRMKIDYVLDTDKTKIKPMKSDRCNTCANLPICENKVLPVVSCSTCAFFSDKENKECALGNQVGIKCASHLYNPLLLVNHDHIKVDVQNMYVEYEGFINCNSDMGFKPSLTSDEMYAHQQFSKDSILDETLQSFKDNFRAKIHVKEG